MPTCSKAFNRKYKREFLHALNSTTIYPIRRYAEVFVQGLRVRLFHRPRDHMRLRTVQSSQSSRLPAGKIL